MSALKLARPFCARGLSPLAIAVLALNSGCSRRATKAECDAVLDHYVEMLVREQNPEFGVDALRSQTEIARARAAADPTFSDCPRQIRITDVRCALEAPNVDSLEKCLE